MLLAFVGCVAAACGGTVHEGVPDSSAAPDATAGPDVDAATLDASRSDAPDGADTSDAGGQGAFCQRESDCASGFDCGYAIADGCSAHGTCVSTPGGPYSFVLAYYCACDGVQVMLANNFHFPYAPTPIGSGGYCPSDAGAPADAGACTAWGGSCRVTSNCCAGMQCIDQVPTNLYGYCVP